MEAEEYDESARWLEKLDDEMVIEAAGTKTLERLYQLVQKGYRPDLDMQFAGAIWFHHPSKNFEHTLVYLYPSGRVISPGATDEFRFDRSEDAAFQKFLRSVPQPTFWERTRQGRTNFAAWVIIGSVIIGPSFLVFVAMRFFEFK